MRINAYAVIMAGGKGERFWPLSTSRTPKQFLPIAGNETLLARTVDRLRGLIPARRIVIITDAAHARTVRRIAPSVPPENIFGEPVGRDTAAACALGTAIIAKRDPSAVACVMPADHIIGDIRVFHRTLAEAVDVSRREKSIVTIGIRPAFPSTGYGYIEAGGMLKHRGRVVFNRARRFVEKPDRATAERYIKTGRYHWNAGIFVWPVEVFLEELRRLNRPLFAMTRRIGRFIGGSGLAAALKSEYRKLKRISVDYAVMEKTDKVVVARGNFAWDDVGAWSSLANHVKADRRGNVIVGACERLSARNNIVVSGARLTALVGVSNLVVVQAKSATLVCSRERAQDVKKMVALLGARNKYRTLV